ncbi:MAG: hypothetical protein K940chlam2_00028 [Chlamydiae bacterium]|nr:hypothetical protein [Chlamydiota bacterium]
MTDPRETLSKFAPRLFIPPGSANSLSTRLATIAMTQHVAQRWMAVEIGKLIPEALWLEKAPLLWAAAGFAAGMIVMLIVVVLAGLAP